MIGVESDSSAKIIGFKGKLPIIHPTVFLCHGAIIVGDVEISEYSSVWFNVVIRGDVGHIRIGSRTNIQDLSMLHVSLNKSSLAIGNDVTIGHSSILHGCTVEDAVLIGMGARILDGAVIRTNSIVAAGSVVREGFEIPEGVLAAGVPAKIKRELTDAEREGIVQSSQNYIKCAAEYQQTVTIPNSQFIRTPQQNKPQIDEIPL